MTWRATSAWPHHALVHLVLVVGGAGLALGLHIQLVLRRHSAPREDGVAPAAAVLHLLVGLVVLRRVLVHHLPPVAPDHQCSPRHGMAFNSEASVENVVQAKGVVIFRHALRVVAVWRSEDLLKRIRVRLRLALGLETFMKTNVVETCGALLT